VHGASIGAWPQHGLVVVDGRLAALQSGDSNDDRLAPPAALAFGRDRARGLLRSLGVEVGEAVIRRLDPAAELVLDDQLDGFALLRAFAGGALVASGKRVVYDRCHDGRVETVNWLTPVRGQKRLRLYDAGLHHGSHLPGLRVRLEALCRWPKPAQRPVEAWSVEDLRTIHLRRVRPWLTSAPSLTVVSPSQAKHDLERLIAAGEVTDLVGSRLIGLLDLIERGTATDLLKPETKKRWTADLRSLGISVAVGATSEVERVDLLPMLRAIDERWQHLAAEEASGR
jgi:hypothetical protein